MRSKTVAVKGEYIRLCDLLKFAGLCHTGGEAKLAITGGNVTVDDRPCTERGKKIRPGQKVRFGEDEIEVKGET